MVIKSSLSRAVNGPWHCRVDVFREHGGSPKHAVGPKHYWNHEDLDALRAERDWIDSAFAPGRVGRPRPETQQLTLGDVPERCLGNRLEENEERNSWGAASFRCKHSVSVDTDFAPASYFLRKWPHLHPRLHGLIH